MSILSVGTVAFDSIETPFGSVNRMLGGSATYITLAAQYLTRPVGLVAVVGRDFPEVEMDRFGHFGIDTTGLQQNLGGDTFAWAGRYHQDMNQRDTLATHLNVLSTFEPSVPDAYRTGGIVCLGNLDPGIQMKVLDQITSPDLVVLDTMNFWIENTPGPLMEVLSRVDVLIINDQEARQLANDPSLVKAARVIRAMGPKTLVIKKGEHGALLFSGDEVFSAPGLPLEEVIDPTGAGDAFAGGFVGYLAAARKRDAEDFKQAVIYGSTLASFTVEAFGPEKLYTLDSLKIAGRVALFRALSGIPALDRVAVR